jgi:hypothetical protein
VIRQTFDVYGLRVRSTLALPAPALADVGDVDAEIITRPASYFSSVHRAHGLATEPAPWFNHARLPDGSEYLRWSGLFEFLVAADGRRIDCRPLARAAREPFQTYLLSQVLSFALLKQGIEPLHATTVVRDGQAIGFVGDCGAGKSTLGAAFLAAGHALLTDDLLVLKADGKRFLAYPGPPRVKLFPETAERLLGKYARGTPMNTLTPKLIIPLDGQAASQPAILKALYLLPAPTGRQPRSITLRPLSPRRAFLELLRNTFNAIVVDAPRLERQLDQTARLVTRVPIKSLSYPRSLALLPAVRDAIESDLAA